MEEQVEEMTRRAKISSLRKNYNRQTTEVSMGLVKKTIAEQHAAYDDDMDSQDGRLVNLI